MVKNYIEIYLSDDGTIENNSGIKKIGKTFENEVSFLIIHLTETMLNKEVYLEFQNSKNKWITPKLDISNGKITYALTNRELEEHGYLYCEVILKENKTNWKSDTMLFEVNTSIEASEEIKEEYPDFVEEAQKVIDLIKTDGNGQSFLSDNGTYKEVESDEKINVSDFQKALENISGNSIGHECETINEVLQEINRFYAVAKIEVNAIDSETGNTLNVSYTITGATKEEDGYYYLMASDTTWTMLITCSGYITQRKEFIVTDEEATKGIKEINVEMIART